MSTLLSVPGVAVTGPMCLIVPDPLPHPQHTSTKQCPSAPRPRPPPPPVPRIIPRTDLHGGRVRFEQPRDIAVVVDNFLADLRRRRRVGRLRVPNRLRRQPPEIFHHDGAILPVRRPRPGVRPLKSGSARQRGALLPQREPPQADLHPESGLPGAGPRPGGQEEALPAEQQHSAIGSV
jgi:hypothetical protein